MGDCIVWHVLYDVDGPGMVHLYPTQEAALEAAYKYHDFRAYKLSTRSTP